MFTLFLVLVFVGLIYLTHSEMSLTDICSKSLQIVLRSMISKGTPNVLKSCQKSRKKSFKTAILTVLLATFCIFTMYRCAMNAFLAKRIQKLQINSLQDLDDKGYSLILWPDAFVEGILSNAERGTEERDVYDSLKKSGRIAYMESAAQGIQMTASGKFTVFEYPIGVMQMRD